MPANRWRLVSVLAASLMSSGGAAMAQMSMYAPTPSSGVGGYAGNAMQGIYQQSIGANYTVGSMVQNAQRGAVVPYVGQSVQTSPGYDLGLSSAPTSKPFSQVSRPPTVSPWMNMFREDLNDQSGYNYQTLVRPLLEQERFNRQFERQNTELGQRIQSISAQNAYNPQGSQQIYPTGHPTVFMNYGHFFPGPSRRRGR